MGAQSSCFREEPFQCEGHVGIVITIFYYWILGCSSVLICVQVLSFRNRIEYMIKKKAR